MSVWLLVPICLCGMALLMAVSHGAQKLALRVWDEIEGDGLPQSEDVERSRRHRVAQAARAAALLLALVVLVAVVIAAKVAEDQVRSYPPSEALQDVKQTELDAINDSVFGSGGTRPVPTWTPVPLSEEFKQALRNLRTPNRSTTAQATQP